MIHVTWTLVDDSARGQNDQKSRVYYRLGKDDLQTAPCFWSSVCSKDQLGKALRREPNVNQSKKADAMLYLPVKDVGKFIYDGKKRFQGCSLKV